jgi:hypothetical protein
VGACWRLPSTHYKNKEKKKSPHIIIRRRIKRKEHSSLSPVVEVAVDHGHDGDGGALEALDLVDLPATRNGNEKRKKWRKMRGDEG